MLAVLLQTGEAPPTARELQPRPLVVADLVAQFLAQHASYYVGPDGRQTGELGNYVEAFEVLSAVAASQPAAEFTPRWFKEVQRAMVAKGWCRRHCNDQLRRIKRLFKWGVSEELVPPAVHHGALAVEGLKRFRSAAPESSGVDAVPEGVLEAVLPHLPPMIGAWCECSC